MALASSWFLPLFHPEKNKVANAVLQDPILGCYSDVFYVRSVILFHGKYLESSGY